MDRTGPHEVQSLGEQQAVFHDGHHYRVNAEDRNGHLNSRMWLCSFPFLGASGNKDTRVPRQGVFSFLSPGASAAFVGIMLALQAAAQALVMNIICTKEWARTVRTSLPPHSNKVRLVYHSSYAWNSLGGYSVLFTYGVTGKIPLSPLWRAKPGTVRSRQRWRIFQGEIGFSPVTWFWVS